MSLLALAKLIGAHLSREPGVRLTRMVNLAEANPQAAFAQDFAAREAWRQGDVQLAQRLAQRAVALDADSLAALRILAEISADESDGDQTYQYAKRFLEATRIDRQVEPWVRITLAPFCLIPSYRKRIRDFFEGYVPRNDESVQWAREYVEWYETEHTEASNMRWLEPWAQMTEDAALTRELRLELPKKHILFGVAVKAIARRFDRDDVLYELLDGSSRVAVVHLTYNKETNPEWPHTELFGSIEEFARERMAPDHEGLDA